ncbi:MAG: hypothetical protein ACRBFS_26505 [Aureispira sp.]
MGWYDKSQNPAGYGGKSQSLRWASGKGTHDALGSLSEDGTHSIPGIMTPPQLTSYIPKTFGRPGWGEQYLTNRISKKTGGERLIDNSTRKVTAQDINLLNRGWSSGAMQIGKRKIKMGMVDNIIRDENDNITTPNNAYQYTHEERKDY